MNTTRILTTLAAAAAMTGGIGFAYAQTATGQAPVSTDSTQMNAPAPSADTSGMKGNSSAMPSSSSSSSTPAPMSTDSTAAPTESPPKADRG
jgi:hypothetical protein